MKSLDTPFDYAAVTAMSVINALSTAEALCVATEGQDPAPPVQDDDDEEGEPGELLASGGDQADGGELPASTQGETSHQGAADAAPKQND